MNEFQRWLMVAVEPTSMASLRATPPQNQGLIPSNAGPFPFDDYWSRRLDPEPPDPVRSFHLRFTVVPVA